MFLVAGPLLYGYAVSFFVQGLPFAAGTMLFSALSITISIILYFAPIGRRIGESGFNAIVIVGVLVPLLLTHFNVMWMNGRLEFLAWLFVYPPIAFFLLGEKRGFLLLCLFAIVGVFCFVVPPPRGVHPIPMTAMLLENAIALLCCGLIAWVSERTRRQTFDWLSESSAQLRAARDDLERRVSERTAALHAANARLSGELAERERLEARFVQAQKMESIGILAGGIAHDFNNILQIILGYTQVVLSEKVAADPDFEALSVVLTGTQRAIQLTRQLLLFSRHEQGTLRPLDLNAHVREVIQLLDRTISKMITIETRFAEDLKCVSADPGQIQQVIMNLAVNARDAMPEGGRLTFETKSVYLDGDFAEKHPGVQIGEHVQLSIIDTGMGMDEETQRHIYDPFFTTKDLGKGTGLGLSVAYGIIANHHGFISCRSKPGEGTTFTFFLPALDQPTDTSTSPAPPVAEIRGGSEQILCVDDDEHILAWEGSILGKKGYRVLTAASGEEALRRYPESAPDLVILDMDMPGMGGYQCLLELRAMDPEVTVMIASGYSSGFLPGDLLDQGALVVLPKPFTSEGLLRHVRNALDGMNEPLEACPPVCYPLTTKPYA